MEEDANKRIFPNLLKRETQISERIVQPLGLVAKRTVWYLVAANPAADGKVDREDSMDRNGNQADNMGNNNIRTYRVSRIAHAEVLEESFPYPEPFHLAQYWEQSTAQFKQSIPRYIAQLRMEPFVRRQWEQQPFLKILHAGPVEEDGRLEASVQFATLEHAVNMVLGFGPAVTVLEPDELRAAVIAAAKATLSQYTEALPCCEMVTDIDDR